METMKKSDITKRKLLQSVEELLDEKKFEAITIRDITNHAGLAVGTFYKYFSCKEEALLYIYRQADDTFRDLEESDNPTQNIRRILVVYYHMVENDHQDLDRAIYRAHLTFHDDYFFTEERELFRRLCANIKALEPNKNAGDMTWKLLVFMRGLIYNYLITFTRDEAWHEHCVSATIDYLTYLLH